MKRIPLSIPDLRGREAELLMNCVRDNWVSSAGPEVSAFETGTAELTGRSHAVATVNGTAALHLALLAVGVRPGDRVIVPDWTFAASVNAVAHAGATPVFVDVRHEDWALDPAIVERALRSDAGIRAVIAVDPVGHAADMDPLSQVCAAAGVALVEDAAGAIGATYHGRPCGSFGDVSIFSFNGNKTVTAGGGGMVLTDNAEIARTVRHRSTQARPGTDYIHDAVGYNYRMTNLNAAVGLAQLERLGEMVEAKRAIAARYDAALADRDDVKPMPRPAHSDSSCWLYNVQVSHEDAARSLVGALAADNIEARIFWRSLSVQAPWQDAPRHLSGVSEALSGRVVSLPCSSSLTRDEQVRVVGILSMWSGVGVAAA
jgi:dTDP-4-amino-4,6-dideoxygalactose transaminase